MKENILEISNLNKAYGEHKALDNFSLNVKKGAIFGLLGPNGAGKTTLLRIINTILVPDSGSVLINGQKAELGVTTRHIGYMPEERGLYAKMRVDEQIMYFGLLKGCDKQTLQRNMTEYMDIFNIPENDRHRRVEELSKGNQQKVQILATVVHRPELIILDEPFSGFDPINGRLLTQLIARLREQNSTIILSSHNMPAIEEMATHIALINKGRLLLDGEVDDIKEKSRSGHLYVVTSAPLSVELALDSPAIQEIEPAVSKRKNTFAYRILPKLGASNNDVISAVSLQGNILQFEELMPTLTELFIKYTDAQ
ncbi:MAG: ATP-binding cassette domain-containing protein [Prevotella sp.]|nr:ATP-binding cassette domain-containing protein [Prevotella sp.]MCM1074293.1 ATP-binding cassette domain-containing protein [Ruminococcus sp.]